MAVSVTMVDVVVVEDDAVIIDDDSDCTLRWTTGSRLSMAVSSVDSSTSEKPSNWRTNWPEGEDVMIGCCGSAPKENAGTTVNKMISMSC